MAALPPPPRQQQWVRGPVIGRGATATVSLATCWVTGSTFAVKSVDLQHSASLQREQRFLASIPPSPHVVRYLGFDVTADGDRSGGGVSNLFLELALGGSVADEIARHGRLEQSKVRSFARDILLGVAHLHSNGVAHCDVKPGNVLFDGAACKLADLGCAKRVFGGDDAATDTVVGGSPMYMAPEVARGEAQGTAADVWALGCTVIEMVTGRPPWPDVKDPVAAMHRIGFSAELPKLPEGLGEDGGDFLRKCLVRDPAGRWSAEELLAHPFTSSCCSVGKREGKDGFFATGHCGDDANWRWRPSPKCVLDGDDLWGCSSSVSTSSSIATRELESEDENHDGRPAASGSSTAGDRIGQLAGPSSCSTWADATMSSSSWAWNRSNIVDDNDDSSSSSGWITIRGRHSGGRSTDVSESKTSSAAHPSLAVTNPIATATGRNRSTPPSGVNYYCHLQQSCKVEKQTAM